MNQSQFCWHLKFPVPKLKNSLVSRFLYIAMAGCFCYVMDGTSLWVYSGEVRKYRKQPHPAQPNLGNWKVDQNKAAFWWQSTRMKISQTCGSTTLLCCSLFASIATADFLLRTFLSAPWLCLFVTLLHHSFYSWCCLMPSHCVGLIFCVTLVCLTCHHDFKACQKKGHLNFLIILQSKAHQLGSIFAHV